MSKAIIIGEEDGRLKELALGMSGAGLTFSIVSPDEDVLSRVSDVTPDLVIVSISEKLTLRRVEEYAEELKHEMKLPVLALIPKSVLFNLRPGFPIDDFVVMPCDEREFQLRVRWLLHVAGSPDTGELTGGGGLVLDTAGAEVTLNGSRLDLTYREYELLRFFLANKGRVFTREALLNKVWGFDYYGGDRTVDVHIRRLRGKIEVNGTVYIETVRNIGYRFKEDA